jgi:hypothetical protein
MQANVTLKRVLNEEQLRKLAKQLQLTHESKQHEQAHRNAQLEFKTRHYALHSNPKYSSGSSPLQSPKTKHSFKKRNQRSSSNNAGQVATTLPAAAPSRRHSSSSRNNSTNRKRSTSRAASPTSISKPHRSPKHGITPVLHHSLASQNTESHAQMTEILDRTGSSSPSSSRPTPRGVTPIVTKKSDRNNNHIALSPILSPASVNGKALPPMSPAMYLRAAGTRVMADGEDTTSLNRQGPTGWIPPTTLLSKVLGGPVPRTLMQSEQECIAWLEDWVHNRMKLAGESEADSNGDRAAVHLIALHEMLRLIATHSKRKSAFGLAQWEKLRAFISQCLHRQHELEDEAASHREQIAGLQRSIFLRRSSICSQGSECENGIDIEIPPEVPSPFQVPLASALDKASRAELMNMLHDTQSHQEEMYAAHLAHKAYQDVYRELWNSQMAVMAAENTSLRHRLATLSALKEDGNDSDGHSCTENGSNSILVQQNNRVEADSSDDSSTESNDTNEQDDVVLVSAAVVNTASHSNFASATVSKSEPKRSRRHRQFSMQQISDAIGAAAPNDTDTNKHLMSSILMNDESVQKSSPSSDSAEIVRDSNSISEPPTRHNSLGKIASASEPRLPTKDKAFYTRNMTAMRYESSNSHLFNAYEELRSKYEKFQSAERELEILVAESGDLKDMTGKLSDYVDRHRRLLQSSTVKALRDQNNALREHVSEKQLYAQHLERQLEEAAVVPGHIHSPSSSSIQLTSSTQHLPHALTGTRQSVRASIRRAARSSFRPGGLKRLLTSMNAVEHSQPESVGTLPSGSVTVSDTISDATAEAPIRRQGSTARSVNIRLCRQAVRRDEDTVQVDASTPSSSSSSSSSSQQHLVDGAVKLAPNELTQATQVLANTTLQRSDSNFSIASIANSLGHDGGIHTMSPQELETAVSNLGAAILRENMTLSGDSGKSHILVYELDRQYYENRLHELQLIFQVLQSEWNAASEMQSTSDDDPLGGHANASMRLDHKITENLVHHLKSRNFGLAKRVALAQSEILQRMMTLRAEAMRNAQRKDKAVQPTSPLDNNAGNDAEELIAIMNADEKDVGNSASQAIRTHVQVNTFVPPAQALKDVWNLLDEYASLSSAMSFLEVFQQYRQQDLVAAFGWLKQQQRWHTSAAGTLSKNDKSNDIELYGCMVDPNADLDCADVEITCMTPQSHSFIRGVMTQFMWVPRASCSSKTSMMDLSMLSLDRLQSELDWTSREHSITARDVGASEIVLSAKRPAFPSRGLHIERLVRPSIAMYIGNFRQLLLTDVSTAQHAVHDIQWILSLCAFFVSKKLSMDMSATQLGQSPVPFCELILHHYLYASGDRQVAELHVMELVANLHAHCSHPRVETFGALLGIFRDHDDSMLRSFDSSLDNLTTFVESGSTVLCHNHLHQSGFSCFYLHMVSTLRKMLPKKMAVRLLIDPNLVLTKRLGNAVVAAVLKDADKAHAHARDFSNRIQEIFEETAQVAGTRLQDTCISIDSFLRHMLWFYHRSMVMYTMNLRSVLVQRCDTSKAATASAAAAGVTLKMLHEATGEVTHGTCSSVLTASQVYQDMSAEIAAQRMPSFVGANTDQLLLRSTGLSSIANMLRSIFGEDFVRTDSHNNGDAPDSTDVIPNCAADVGFKIQRLLLHKQSLPIFVAVAIRLFLWNFGADRSNMSKPASSAKQDHLHTRHSWKHAVRKVSNAIGMRPKLSLGKPLETSKSDSSQAYP